MGEADLVGSSLGARMVLELARRGVGRHTVALDPGGFWNDPGKGRLRHLFKLLRPREGAATSAPGTGRQCCRAVALLPHFTPRRWAVPGEVALVDLQSIANTAALSETLAALLGSGSEIGRPTRGRIVLAGAAGTA